MSQLKHSESEREPLLSQQKRFPQVFKWKVAAIVISVLIAIFLVVDIILWVHYNNSQPRKINYTFLADLLDQTASQNDAYSKQQFVNIADAFSSSYQELWFRSATLIQAITTPPLTLDNVGSFFDGDSSDNQFFLFTLKDGANNAYLAAAFSHIGFPLPSGNWQDYITTNKSNHYYTFEILDRQSVILGGGSNQSLRMSGSTADLRKCTVINLWQTSMSFLEVFSLDFTDPAAVAVSLPVTDINSICFDGQPNAATVLGKLQRMISGASGLTLSKVEVFHLAQ